jgi:hypothetical protein
VNLIEDSSLPHIFLLAIYNDLSRCGFLENVLERRKTAFPHHHLSSPACSKKKKKNRGWGSRNKNNPENPDHVSIIDGGWNGPVKLLDPRRGAPAPPKD